MNIFIDIEFNRESQEINSIGAVYGKNTFFQKCDKHNKNPLQILNRLYNFIPHNVNCLFFFFGKEDIRVFRTNRYKYEFPDVINKMLDNIVTNAVDLSAYIFPVRLSLDGILNELSLNVKKPIHDPLNDAINLQTLYDGLKAKGIISRLIKIVKSYGKSNAQGLSRQFEDSLKNLFSLKPGYIKDTEKIQTKITLINKENGHEYVLNDISGNELDEDKFYKIKTPKILLDYTGNKRECVIFILENLESKTLTIENPDNKLYENMGMSLEFCQKFIQELLDKDYFIRLSPSIYQIKEKISFLDSASSRRILLDKDIKNKISIIS